MNENIEKELNGLTPEQKELALKILKEYSEDGSSDTYNSIVASDYEEVPVSIEEFLHNRKYLGNALYDQEGRFTLFPYWEEKLKEIFPTNISTAYNTIILTGAIGLGKSTIAVICQLYLLYRLLCLKDPYLYYGLQPIDKISISLMNITIENAKGVALDKMNQMILSSEWFMSHGEMSGTTNMIFNPQKHIEVITASSNNQVIGRAIFANFTDEVNFGLTNDVEKLKKKQKQLISQIDARMKSRFMRGTFLPTLNIIASSKNSDQSFLDSYIETKRKNESKNTLIVDEPQWVVDSRKDSDKHFFVAIGNKYLANELLPIDAEKWLVDEYRAKGYQMLEVPIGYYENFQDNIDGALTDIAGIATASSLKYISGIRWNDIKTDSYQNPFVQEVIQVGTGEDDTAQYQDFFDTSRVPIEMKSRPLYIHLDMSVKGDRTGISGVWVTGKRPKVEGESSSRELYYKVAFSVGIEAPKGKEISFDKNRAFIRWLRDQGFSIRGVSCFAGDTLISTPYGNKRIDEIRTDDIIYAYDEQKQQAVECKVSSAQNTGIRNEFIHIELDKDLQIECTPEHLILTATGYKQAKDIIETDEIIIDDSIYLKYKLLNTNIFIDNQYLDKYIELINSSTVLDTNKYCERHHVIPRCFYTFNKIDVDNSIDNIVNLEFSNHLRAHFYLSKCTLPPFNYKMGSALCKMMGCIKRLSDLEMGEFFKDTELQNLLLYAKELQRQQAKLQMMGNKNVFGRKHTEEEKLKIAISNRKPHGTHPHSEFQKGNVPWNSGKSFEDMYTKEERKDKFGHKSCFHWYTNGEQGIENNKLIIDGGKVPDGFYLGRTQDEELKTKISCTLKNKNCHPPVRSGYIHITDGFENRDLAADEAIPEGWSRGRTIQHKINNGFIESGEYLNYNKDEYFEYYSNHSRENTLSHFNISLSKHKKLCKFYDYHKPKNSKNIDRKNSYTKHKSSNTFIESDLFKSINLEKYIEFYKTHSRNDTIKEFGLNNVNQHKKICKICKFDKRVYSDEIKSKK